MIEVINLCKSFSGKIVLRDINLQIPPKQTTCIIGKSGSGKSVLIKNIVGLLKPDKGTVFVDDKEIPKLSQKELYEVRKRMGFVFQSSALLDSYNVYGNIVLGLYEQGIRDTNYLDTQAKRVLEAVQLLPHNGNVNKEEYEQEWNRIRNMMPSELSGGMKKRVGLARALVGNPEYIFYDEPTTGLDPVTSEQIDNLIIEVEKQLKVTSIVITHDLFSVYRIADKIAMLNDGEKIFDGDLTEFKTSNNPIIKEFQDRYNQ